MTLNTTFLLGILSLLLPLAASFSRPDSMHCQHSVKSRCASFAPAVLVRRQQRRQLSIILASSTRTDDENEIPSSVLSASERVEECKRDLIRMCDNHVLGAGYSSGIEQKIRDMEQLGEDVSFIVNSEKGGLLKKSIRLYGFHYVV